MRLSLARLSTTKVFSGPSVPTKCITCTKSCPLRRGTFVNSSSAYYTNKNVEEKKEQESFCMEEPVARSEAAVGVRILFRQTCKEIIEGLFELQRHKY